MEPDPGGLFDQIGDNRYLAQRCAVGPHDKKLVAGGALAGLATTVVERFSEHLEPGPGWRTARVTAEFLSPAPLGGVAVDVDPIRSGRTARWTRAIVRGAGVDLAHVTVLELASRPGGDPVDSRWVSAPAIPARAGRGTDARLGAARREHIERVGFSDPAITSERPEWDRLTPMAPWNDGFFGGAVEVRYPDGGFEATPGWCLAELRVPVVTGQASSPTAAAVADLAHGAGAPGHALSAGIVPVNPDLTVSFSRRPSTARFLLDVAQRWSGDGTGLAVCRLWDDGGGDFALVTQTQVLTISGVRR